ncbi:phage tail tube protein [Faecalispora anaeroviscerum]|uniref:phage tail tube protein n=1 Tax=Faecalispora anaeroviscerum TaxID=2991836 RepID=UPI0024BBD928|nr:phage tail tube protein [Faecalispora anaeroviscerum]
MALEFDQKDAIGSNEGTAFVTIDGRNYDLFFAKKIEAKMSKNKEDVKSIGKRSVGKKATSWSGSGTLTIHAVTSLFKEMFVDYANGGADRYFSLQLTNEDSSTSWGRETKVLTGCNFDEIDFANLDSDDGLLEQELPFTFDGVELLEKFNS